MPNQAYNPKAAISESERPQPSYGPEIARPYTSAPQSGDLGAFTQTRPFHHCADCGWDLPASAGALCSRCELARDHSQVSKPPFIADNDADDNDSTYNI